MLIRLLHIWEYLRNSYWLLPAVMLFAAIGLSYAVLAADAQINLSQYKEFRWLIFSTTDGARAVLSTIASSTFAAATLTFSVTMVTLSLTSSQFGPRLLGNFLRDPINQFTFGAFIATFVYCLLIMRGMVVAESRIPNISISLAVIMVLFDAVLFIGFIHHLTSSIRVERISSDIGKEFIEVIYKMFPETYTGTDAQIYDDSFLEQEPGTIRSEKFGYVQAINYHKLSALADNEELTLELIFKPGHFVLPDAPILHIWPSESLQPHVKKMLLSCFILGREPTGEQDLEHTIRQLVQIAARALSPGINDPFTAMTCIDHLGAGLAVIAKRVLPEANIRNDEGRLLLIKNVESFATICDACFIIIRQMSLDNPPVVIYLLETLLQLAAIAKRLEDKEAIKQTAKLTYDSAIDKCQMEYDKKAINQRFEEIIATLSLPHNTMTSLINQETEITSL